MALQLCTCACERQLVGREEEAELGESSDRLEALGGDSDTARAVPGVERGHAGGPRPVGVPLVGDLAGRGGAKYSLGHLVIYKTYSWQVTEKMCRHGQW
jgi:hypothetical protein